MTRWTVLAALFSSSIPGAACISESRPRNTQDGQDGTDAADAVDGDDDVAVEDGADDGDDDAAECANSAQTRCDPSGEALEVCIEGRWRKAPCEDGKICVGGADGALCIAGSGAADCHDTLYCFLACQVAHPEEGEALTACLTICYTAATPQAQGELADVNDCFDGNCQGESSLDCAAQRCSQDLADCYYDEHGQAGCAAIVSCRIDCGDDNECAKACGTNSAIDAQGDYAILELCIFYACYGQDQDCSRRVTLPTGACSDYANECIGLLPNTPR